MNASSWLPWLFFGPLFGAMGSGIAYQATRLPWLATAAQVCMALTLLTGVCAFVAARKARAAPGASDAR